MIRTSDPKPCEKMVGGVPCKGDMRYPLTHYPQCPYFSKRRHADVH